jgi:hypothetical protein
MSTVDAYAPQTDIPEDVRAAAAGIGARATRITHWLGFRSATGFTVRSARHELELLIAEAVELRSAIQ